MNATLTGGVLARALPACAGYTQPPNPKDKRFVWGRLGALEGQPDVTKAKPTTVRAMLSLIGIARSYIVQTYRQKDRGDTIFVETLGGEERVIRIAIR